MKTQDDKNNDSSNPPIAEFDPSFIEDVIRCSTTDGLQVDNDLDERRKAK